MATDTKMNEKKQRLLSLMREMFQLDQPDLDFGLYRIMHAKRAQVETFLESEFDQLIDKVFASRGARQEEAAKQEYEAARQQAIEFGAPDPEAAPKVQQARARYDAVRLTGGEDAEIYDHLHRFFSRYYDQGDFMSLRRYGKGAAGGAETYAVPYDGAEVVQHWANKDQYYIKTTQNFAEFSFDPRKALQKDEKGISRQLFDDAAANGQAIKVHFRIVDAAEGAHNNVKASDKDERYFILDDETPIAWEGKELVVRINYRPDSEKTGQKGKWQEKRNDQLVQKVLDALAGETGDSKALAEEYHSVLSSDVPKGKDKKQPLLARYVGQYTASNTMDYFIHKDLGGFLRRELDFYLKNEVLKLDDFVGGEDADVQGGLTEARMKAMQNALEKAQAIRLLSQRLVDFLAQLEDFQKKLWLKKKFVVETHYCITLDRIPEKLYPQIAASDQQRDEWVRLFAIDEIKGDAVSPAYSVPLTVEFLRANPFLTVDTEILGPSLTNMILQEIEELDRQCDGLLIHSENFQALRMLDSRYRESTSCVYIDPPYNTSEESFLYKNAYKHSSWLSMVDSRARLATNLMQETAVLCCAIDDLEMAYLQNTLDGVFGLENRLGNLVIEIKPSGRTNDKYLATSHEYILFYAKNHSCAAIDFFPLSADQVAQYSEGDGEESFKWRDFLRTGGFSTPEERPNSFYPIYYNPETDTASIEMFDGAVEILPQDSEGKNRVWRKTIPSFLEHLEKGEIKFTKNRKGDWKVQIIDRIKEGTRPKSVWVGPKYDASSHGTKHLKLLFGDSSEFSFPKSVHAVYDTLFVNTSSNPEALVLDFFAGSGTTGQAVINLNRDDKGQRKYILVEQGEYFSSVLKPRIQKVAYATEWKNGKPVAHNTGVSQAIKIIRLESYEDCINNLSLNDGGAAIAKAGDEAMNRNYLLRYMLDVETQGSQSLLNVAQFRDPTAYQLEIKKPGSDEREKRNVDLVETFNWLVGLHVDKLHAGRRFAATFVRNPDPLLPEDANTRLQVETLTEAKDGAWWFRPVEGYVRTKPGDDRHRQSVLVLWRTLTDDPEQDAAALEAFLSQQMKFDPTRREDKTLYDIIYINGTHNLPNLGKYGEVRLLEEEFQRRMWAGEDA